MYAFICTYLNDEVPNIVSLEELCDAFSYLWCTAQRSTTFEAHTHVCCMNTVSWFDKTCLLACVTLFPGIFHVGILFIQDEIKSLLPLGKTSEKVQFVFKKQNGRMQWQSDFNNDSLLSDVLLLKTRRSTSSRHAAACCNKQPHATSYPRSHCNPGEVSLSFSNYISLHGTET